MRHRFVGRGWHDCWHGYWAGPVSAIFLVYYLNFCNIAVSVQIHDIHLLYLSNAFSFCSFSGSHPWPHLSFLSFLWRESKQMVEEEGCIFHVDYESRFQSLPFSAMKELSLKFFILIPLLSLCCQKNIYIYFILKKCISICKVESLIIFLGPTIDFGDASNPCRYNLI